MKKKLFFYRAFLILLLAFSVKGFGQVNHLVISQVYGGGGNTGATYKNDYVEIFNPTSSTVSLNGISIQYASSTGTSWSVLALTTSASIPSGKYYLVSLAGGATGAALPTPDQSSTAINLSATAGKVALVNGTTAFSAIACPTNNIIDFVGYGSGTDCREGTGTANNAPAGSNANSIFRASGGCTDTNVNSSDFSAAVASARNSSTAANICVVSYTLAYNGNGNTSGTAPTDSNSPYSSGSTVTVSGNTGGLVKTGYTFNNWNTAADGSGTPYSGGSTFTISSNTVLYAQWTINSYNVSYDANGGSGTPPSTQTGNYNTAITLQSNTFTRAGYAFNGWNTAADGSGTAYSAGSTFTIPANNTTLYAQWILVGSYTVSYSGNGNTSGTAPTDSNSPYSSGSTVTVSGNTGGLVKTGYTFNNWNTAADGSGTPYSGGSTFTISSNTVLYAQWTINSYNVSYDANGGSGTPPSTQTGNYNTAITLQSNTFTRAGYAFNGWNTAADGSGTAYSTGSTFTIPANNTTLYAQWIVNYCFSDNFSTATSGNNTSTSGSGTAWGGDTYFTPTNVFQAGGAIKLGSSSASGKITSTSAFNSVSGDVLIGFDVKGWSTVEGDIKVTITNSSSGYSESTTVTYTNIMTDSFVNKTVQFYDVPANSILTIETTAKRAFIDNVTAICTTPPSPRPRIQVQGNSVAITNGDNTPSTTDDTDFGTVGLGSSLTHTFTIYNKGTGTLHINNPITLSSGSNGFSISQPSTYDVAANSSVTFTVTFSNLTSGTFTDTVNIGSDSMNASSNFTFDVKAISAASAASDLAPVANSESATVSSTVNDATVSASTQGVQVWQFEVRDGGSSLNDADTLPTILTAITIGQGTGNQVTTWSDAIQSVALFDGTSFIANGTVTANQIQFTGLNVSVADNTKKTLSLRLSLKCPLGSGAVDGDDFVFTAQKANVTFSSSGSGMLSSFTSAASTNGKDIIDVTATKLVFTTQPTTTAVNDAMSTVVVTAKDDCGNTDKGFTGSVSITSLGTMSPTPVSVTASAGIATFSNNIFHTATGNSLTLTAQSGSISGTSSTFDIVNATVLQTGDLAILAVNNNYTTYTPAATTYSGFDEISFVVFKDVNPGTTLYITDNGYERKNANQWGNTEGVISIKRTSAILPKGTIITIKGNLDNQSGNITNPAQFDVYVCGSVDTNWSKTALSGSGIGGFNLNTDDDVWIMQGGVWNNGTTGSHDATYTGNVLYGWTESGWDAAPGGASQSTKWSTLYPASKCFTTVAPPNTTGAKVKFNLQNFISSTTNDQLDWIALIDTTGNWTVYADNASYFAGGYDYYNSCMTMTIANNPNFNGKWTGVKDSNWFDCSNWDTLKIPDATTNVTVSSSATNNIVIDATATDASLYGNVANTNNLVISSGKKVSILNTNDKLYIHGNLSLDSGSTLEMSGGTGADVYLYGNWSRNSAATYNYGGTVHFIGSTTQVINSNNHANYETFYNVDMGNNFDTAISNDFVAKNDLTVAANKTLTVNTADNYVDVQNNVNNNGNIIVKSGGNLIQRSDSGSFNGNNMTAERNASLKRLDYIYWGSPVENRNLKSFSPGTLNSRFMTYDQTTNGFVPVAFTGSAPNYSNVFAKGVGYAIRADNNLTSTVVDNTFTFTGKSNNAIIQVDVARKAADSNGDVYGYNLVANPYPSNISFEQLFIENGGTVDGTNNILTPGLIDYTAYFWTNVNANPAMQFNNYPQTGSINNYAILNRTGGVGVPSGYSQPSVEPNGIIKVGQGFIVRVSQANTGITNLKLNFKNSLRTAASSHFFNYNGTYKSSAAEIPDRFWLNLKTPLNLQTPILVGYVKGGSNNFENAFDSEHLVVGADSFYTVLQGKKLVIQGRQYPLDENDKVALGAIFYESGSHTISLQKSEGVFSNGQPIYLHDKNLGTYTDLQQNSYTFTAAKGTDENRFEIVYKLANTMGTEDNIQTKVIIYKDGNVFAVKSPSKLQKIQVYDASGRLIYDKVTNQNEEKISTYGWLNGTYILKIQNESGILSRKIAK